MNLRTVAVVFAVIALVGLSTGARAQELTDLPPRMIACSPEPFATEVDPGLAEISVTFDRPMSTEQVGFGDLRWAGAYPGVRNAQPQWSADGTTCTLPAEVFDDVTYAVSINATKGRSRFVDTSGVPAVGFAWVFSTGERTPEQFNPRVVSCDPAPGATDVDFRLREITVTFDRPVAPDDYSWVIFRGCGLYPGARDGGAPQVSEDRLTATLPIRLSPGSVYAIGLNDSFYPGYKDLYGRPVLPLGICFRTAD
ncbi:MAG: Ig-like domain-containing protein [Armatimonadota bacterium]